MQLKNCSMSEFMKKNINKSIVCVGASKLPIEMCAEYEKEEIEKHIAYFVDNDIKKWGTELKINQTFIKIYSLEQFLKMKNEDTVILITSRFYFEIFEQLNQLGQLENTDCYIYYMINEYVKPMILHESMIKNKTQQIPKKIHYFWFGHNAMSEMGKECIESWKKYCPDYEIIRWDENNYDITKNKYMKQAYDVGKWAFASDYARLDVIYEHGGIYLDTDVEIIRNIDQLLTNFAFMGFSNNKCVNTGVGFGSIAKLDIIKTMRDNYEKINFINTDGTFDMTPCPYRETEILQNYGLKRNNTFQVIENISVYPTEFLSPIGLEAGILNITSNTFSLHHCSASWCEDEYKKKWSKVVSQGKILSKYLLNN